MFPFGVVSQVFVRSLKFQITVVICLAPRLIDRGDVEWHYWRTQKQGSAEAVPVGSKRVVISLILIILYHNI